MRRKLGSFLAACAVVAAAGGVWAQAPATTPGGGVAALPDLEERIAEVRAAKAAAGEAPQDPELAALLARRERVLGELRTLLDGASPVEHPPAEELATRGGRDLAALERLEDRIAGLRISAAVRERLLAQLDEQAEGARRRLQAAKLAAEGTGAEDPRTFHGRRLAEEELALLRARREAEGRRLAAERELLEALASERDRVEEEFAGRAEELETRLKALARREARWRRRLQEARVRSEAAARVLARREAAAEAKGGDGAAARLEAARLEAQAWALEAEVAAEEVARTERMRELWRRRWAALTRGATAEELRSWRDEARRELAHRRAERAVEQAALEEVRAAVEALANDAPERRWLERMAVARSARLKGIEEETGLLARLEGTLDRRIGRHPAAELAARARERARAAWRFVLAEVDGRQVTLGRLLLALVYLVLGWWVVGRLARRAGSRLLARFALEPGAAAAVGTLVRYALVMLVAVFALWSAGIPLTVFTLAGGALAIGVGFGSQNLVANFISGLILLMERPVKPGDMVEVGGTLGLVEAVGARCTRIRTFDNVHVLVPNSQLLEQPVTNWTYADDVARIKLAVGVAYGSPVRRVEELLLRALAEHPKVLDDPAPTVFFEEFGDSALLFEAQCWITMRSILERKRVLSDLRFRIDELFRVAGIVIAFPQRDVHLDVTGPVEVRWTAGGAPADGGPPMPEGGT